jgi:hypothetical protein
MTIKALKVKTHLYKLNRSIFNGVVMLRLDINRTSKIKRENIENGVAT